MPNNSRVTAFCLAGVIVGLLAVGLVSGTPVRHVIQVLPAALALVMVLRHIEAAYFAALPIFAFWFFIMVAIWLFLLGIARITTGHFTPVEIALTLVIGAASLGGLSQVFRAKTSASRIQCAGWAILFAALQIAALWLSWRPAIADI